MVVSRQNSRLEQSVGRLITSRLPSIGGSHLLAAIGALLALGAAAAACAAPAADEAHERYLADFEAACPSPPEPPKLPWGEYSGRDDMVDAMRAIKAFDAATAAFADCIRSRLAVLQADPGLVATDRTQLTEIAANLADGEVAGSERLVAAFNRELQQFKARPQDQVGRRYVPASFRQRPADLGSCYPDRMRRQGTQASLTVDVRVGVDGSATAFEHAPGATPDMIKGADCVAGRLQMQPATRDGVPEESVARVPITFFLDDARNWVSPTLRSTGDEFVSATAACYPPELGSDGPRGRLLARIHLTQSGRVRRVEVITTTGNAALDEAGRCIARRLRFTPVSLDGKPRAGDVAWEILVLPPAALTASPTPPTP